MLLRRLYLSLLLDHHHISRNNAKHRVQFRTTEIIIMANFVDGEKASMFNAKIIAPLLSCLMRTVRCGEQNMMYSIYTYSWSVLAESIYKKWGWIAVLAGSSRLLSFIVFAHKSCVRYRER